MKRALILLVVAAVAVAAGSAVAEAGCGLGISLGHHFGLGHHHHHHHDSFRHHRHYHGVGYGYGYRPSYSIRIGYGYRGHGCGYRPIIGCYPRSHVHYSRPYRYHFRSYFPAYGFGCASNAYPPATVGGYGVVNNTVAVPGGVVAAPLYARSGDAYGPDAAKEFLGVKRDFAKGDLAAPQPLVVDVKPVDAGRRIVAKPDAAESRIASNTEARSRAAQFVSFGDNKFTSQQYHSAAQRYRFAIEAAPDVADAHFRQGFAYLASNRYDLAVKSLKRGLELDPLWVNSAFRLNDLYGRNKLAKGSHLDALAKAALIDRGNAEHFFLLGVVLHFDGQQERAKKFFQRAERLGGDNVGHIHAFLSPAAPNARDAV